MSAMQQILVVPSVFFFNVVYICLSQIPNLSLPTREHDSWNWVCSDREGKLKLERQKNCFIDVPVYLHSK